MGVNEKLGIEITVETQEALQKLAKFQDVLGQFANKSGDAAKAATNAGSQINSAFKGFDLNHLTQIHTTIGQMTARLTEFYSIRSGLFMFGNEFKTAFAGLISFNQELANTAAISNASTEQMLKLKDAALSIAASSKFSATEVAKSFKELAQAGVNAADLSSVSRTVDMFATGTGSTLDQATKVMTTSMNVWNVAGEKSGRIANVLTAALNASKLEVGQLSTAMNYLANQSALSGNSLENTTSIIAVMANQGIQASTIGTGVAQLMARLMAPTDKFKGLLKEFSISLEEISPRAHTFAEIIKTFETAAIPVERILGALEVRTGRTLASAIQAGSEKFELMEQRITNTNSAAIAYSKALEGVQAQINVLRSEALTSLNTTLQNTGASFTDMKENLQDVIVGLRSAEGQFMLFTSAMALGLTAMTRAAMANPILAALTVALAGVTWGVSKFGEANRETAKDIDAATKASADQAGEYQRKSDGLFTMLSLVDKNKVSEEGYLVIQDKNVKGIRAVMNEFPQLFTGLDLKKLKYTELTEVIRKYNLERNKELSADISTGNSQADRINQIKTDLAASVKYESDNENKGAWNFQQFTTAKLRDQLKLAEDSYAKMISANLAPRSDVEIFLDNQGTKRSRKVTPPPDTPRGEAVIVPDKVHTGKTPEERAETVLARLGEDQKDLAKKLQYQKAKIDRESAEVTLKDKTLSEEDYLIKEAAAIKLLDKEYADKQIADRTNTFTKLAKALDGAYTQPDSKNPTGHLSFDKRFNEDAVKMLIDQTNKNLNYQTTTVDQAAKDKELERIRLMKPESSAPPKLTAPLLEKQMMFEMQARQQSINLRKEEAHTAEDIATLDKEALTATIAMNQMKVHNLESDNAKIDLWKAGPGLLEKNKDELDKLNQLHDSNAERIKTENLLLEEQNSKLSRLSNNTFFFNLAAGFDKAAIALGTFKSNTEALGEKLSSQLFSGVEGSINNTLDTWTNPDTEKVNSLKDQISKLNQQKAELEGSVSSASAGSFRTPEQSASLANQKVQLQGINIELEKQGKLLDQQTNGFARFRDSMAKMLQDIASELQKYIVHMLVVYSVQKLIGFATSAAIPNNGDLGANNYSSALKIDPQFKAEGGPVLNGLGGGQVPFAGYKAGLDSVPIYAQPGEFVIKKSVVDHFSPSYFAKLNSERFADGGLIGGGSGSSAAASRGNVGKEEGQEWSLTINNFIDKDHLPRTISGAEVLNYIAADAMQNGATTRLLKGRILDR